MLSLSLFLTFADYCWCGMKGWNYYVLQKSKFSPCDTTYSVLLMRFTPDVCEFKDDVSTKIKRRLDKLNEVENLGINTYVLESKPTENFDQDSATYVQTLHNASLIIYGNYSKGRDQCNSDNLKEFCLYWRKDTLQKQESYEVSTQDINSGKLQGDMETTLFWIIGLKDFASKDYAKALKRFLYIQDSLKNSFAGLKFNIGFLYEKQKQYEQAKNYYEESISLDSTYSNVYGVLGLLLEDIHNYKEAKINYEKAIMYGKSSKDSAVAYHNLAHLLLNEYFRDENDEGKNLREAKFFYEKAIGLNKNYALAYSNLGRVLLFMHQQELKEGDLVVAKKMHEKAIFLDKKLAVAYDGLGSLLADEYFKDYKEAKKNYEKAIALDTNYVHAYTDLAMLLDEHFKDYEGAKKNYEKAIALDTNYVHAYYNLGILMSEGLKNYKKAKEYYEKALELDKNNSHIYGNLGILLHTKFNEHGKAKNMFEKGIEVSKSKKDKSIHFSNLGYILALYDKDYINAEKNILKALELNSDNAKANQTYATLLFMSNLPNTFAYVGKIQFHYRKAISLNPNARNIYFEQAFQQATGESLW